jgi:hypothetical protein
MQKIYMLLAAGSFYACTPKVNYVGQRYPAVTEVKVYVDERAVDKPYTVIGRGYTETLRAWPYNRMPEKIQAKAVATAKKNGADAILFRDVLWLGNGTSINSSSRTDSLPGAVITTSSTHIGPVNSRETEILFLKFR